MTVSPDSYSCSMTTRASGMARLNVSRYARNGSVPWTVPIPGSVVSRSSEKAATAASMSLRSKFA